MHFLRAAASGLILGQTSHAWLLQFANIGSCVESDQVEEKGPADGNECVALAMSDAVAMTITGWEPNCRVLLWDEAGMSCGKGTQGVEPILNVTATEAKDQKEAIFDQATGKACYRNLAKGPPKAVSYMCPPKAPNSPQPSQSGQPQANPPNPPNPPQPSQSEASGGRTRPPTKPNNPAPNQPKPQQSQAPGGLPPGDDGGW